VAQGVLYRLHVCDDVGDPLKLTVQADTWAELMEDIGHTLDAMLRDLFRSNELDKFLRDHSGLAPLYLVRTRSIMRWPSRNGIIHARNTRRRVDELRQDTLSDVRQTAHEIEGKSGKIFHQTGQAVDRLGAPLERHKLHRLSA
jgi:hypothetical protein